ncbi:MAG: hypothetical protein WD851_19590 [Pirellulales bacterium]
MPPKTYAPSALRELLVKRIKTQLGLGRAPLLDRHVATIVAIANSLPVGTRNSYPLREVNEHTINQVRGLVAQLPMTREVVEWLAATVDGPVVHRV